MDNYRFLEYRPGRWIKVDAKSGEFVGQASTHEVLAWQRAQDSQAGPAQSPDTITPDQVALRGSEQTPPAPAKEQPPQAEGKAEPETPQQPKPKKEAEPQPPEKPAPEKKAAPQPPEQKKPKPPAPKKRIHPPQGLGVGAAEGMKLSWPLPKRYRISCNFQGHKKRTPPSKAPGIDLACPMRTNVYAWASGKVIRSRWSPKGGRSLWIQHGRGFKTYYAHLNCAYVLEGERVKVGQKIGESGSTGNSTGPHLHFSVVRSGRYVDPERFLVFEQAGKV